MKKLVTAVIVGIAFAGVSLTQTSAQERAGKRQAAKAAAVRVAVIEFSPGPNAPGMTHEAKRQLQASMAFALEKTKIFRVVDVRHTRDASASDLVAINGEASTAAAVRVGKQLGVSHVLTGTVVEYTPKGADGFGVVTLKTRFIEVATGEVKHAEEMTQRSTSAMRSDGATELHTKAIRPALEKLAATLVGVQV